MASKHDRMRSRRLKSMHIIPHMTGEPDDIRMTSHVIPLQTSRSLACLTTDDDLDAVNTVKEGALPDASMQSHDFRAPTESDGGRSAYGKQSRSRAGSAGTTSVSSSHNLFMKALTTRVCIGCI